MKSYHAVTAVTEVRTSRYKQHNCVLHLINIYEGVSEMRTSPSQNDNEVMQVGELRNEDQYNCPSPKY